MGTRFPLRSLIKLALRLPGTILHEAYVDCGSVWDPKRITRALRERFTTAARGAGMDTIDDPDELSREAGCIGELMLFLGGKPSAKDDKVWSTSSDKGPGDPLAADASARADARSAAGVPARPLTLEDLAGQLAGVDRAAAEATTSPLRARVAALEMEFEALRRGSEVSTPEKDLAAALAAQTEALKEALATRGGQSSVTSVKTDLIIGPRLRMMGPMPETSFNFMKNLRTSAPWRIIVRHGLPRAASRPAGALPRERP